MKEPVMSEPMSPESNVCPQCGSDADWTISTWCEACGYYPAAGQFVGTPADALEAEEEEVYENWWEAVPSWLWVLIGGTVGIFVISVAVRIFFEESPVRVWWTAVQLGGGVVAFAVSHLLAYLYAAPNSDRIGPLDAFMKPIATWQPVLQSLPKKVRLLWSVTWGLTAALTAFFLIDGIDYQAIVDNYAQAATEKKQTKANTIAAIVQTAKSAAKVEDRLPEHESSIEASKTLGESITEFTGAEAGEEDFAAMNHGEESSGDGNEENGPLAEGEAGPEDEGPQEGEGEADDDNGPSAESLGTGILSDEVLRLRESIECVVFGFTTNDEGVPRSLLLAAPIQGRLTFVAKVPLSRVLPAAYVGIEERFSLLLQSWPVVTSPYGAHWLKPKLFCHVRFSHWTGAGRLNEPFVTEFAMATEPQQEPHDAKLATP